jgi:hypothetical protein
MDLPNYATIPFTTKVQMTESSRLPHRRVLRHIFLASALMLLSVIFMRFFSKRDTISRISIGTAYSALFLTGLALVLGPWNVLRRQFNPVSFDLRRDTGIWAGLGPIVHTGVSVNVHLRGRPWLYFVNEHHHLRVGMFGFGNYAGLVAALLFAMLLGNFERLLTEALAGDEVEVVSKVGLCSSSSNGRPCRCIPKCRKTQIAFLRRHIRGFCRNSHPAACRYPSAQAPARFQLEVLK